MARRHRVKGSAIGWRCVEDVERIEFAGYEYERKVIDHNKLSGNFYIRSSADQFLAMAKDAGHPTAYLESIPGYVWTEGVIA